MLLGALLVSRPEDISCGGFAPNEECPYCFDLGPGPQNRPAISSKRMVEEGMRITKWPKESRYCVVKPGGLNRKVENTTEKS